MTTENLLFGTDSQGRNAYAPNISNLKYRAFLSQNVASTITLPTGEGFQNYEVCFSYSGGANVWVDCSGVAATVPVNTTLQATTAEYNPGQRLVPAGSDVSVITPDVAGAYVGVAIYGK
jgi:hypothetical protein